MECSQQRADSSGNDSEDIDRLDLSTINSERQMYLTDSTGQQEMDEPEVVAEVSQTSRSEEEDAIGGTTKSVSGSSVCSAELDVDITENAEEGSPRDAVGNSKSSSGSRFRKTNFKLKFFNRNHKGPKSNSSEESSEGTPAASDVDSITKDEEVRSEASGSVRVIDLPQYFVVKYLGRRPCSGYHGLHIIRKPIDNLVKSVGSMRPGTDLPLVKLCVSGTGISTNIHPMNSGSDIDSLMFPVQFISYAVQDVKFCRILALIYVCDAATPKEKPECHCFVCPTPQETRRLALSMSESFKYLSSRLRGEFLICKRNQSVDGRTPDEIVSSSRDNSYA